MTDLRTAAQQALEALEMLAQPTKTNSETPRYKAHKAAITALRAALAQQTQTPCDIAEDGVCEVIDCCRNPPQHDETQMLNSAYQSACEIVSEQDKKLAELEAVNAELLKALRNIVNLWDHHASAHGDGIIYPLHEAARAAIAKAEGTNA